MSEAAKSDFLVRIRTAVSIEEIDAAIRAIPVNNEPIGERYVVAVVRLEDRAKDSGERIADALEAMLIQQAKILEVTGRLEHSSSDREYMHTINLNVPLPYRQPQLDLSMVRMRTALDQVKNAIKTIRDLPNHLEEVEVSEMETIKKVTEPIIRAFEEALIPK